jgi:hypothetical protein
MLLSITSMAHLVVIRLVKGFSPTTARPGPHTIACTCQQTSIVAEEVIQKQPCDRA